MPERIARKVLLIGWDAADWMMIKPLIDQGWMPTLKRFMDEGVWGNLATLNPILSPMLWTSIVTGKRPPKHGIYGFTEADPSGQGVRLVHSTSRKCKAIWNILAQKGLESNIVGWYASHPAEPIKGAVVSDMYPKVKAAHGSEWPLEPRTIHPQEIAETLAELRVHPGELDQGHLQPFIPNMAQVDQKKDTRLAILARMLATCGSVHGAVTWLMDNRPWDFTGVYYDAIDHMGHAFMQFHPPKMQHVTDEQFELYKDVVTGCYKYHDMMLHRLLELAGDDTTVIICSDHGFYSDHMRPKASPQTPTGPTVWHRPYGIICMKGPGIKKGERIYGASLLDITPTVLTLLGLSVGSDMDGRPLLQAFDPPVTSDKVISWEAIEGQDGRLSQDAPQDAEASAQAVAQLVDLGYIDPPDENKHKAAQMATRENNYQLAISLRNAGQIDEAAKILEDLMAQAPEMPRYSNELAKCRYQLGDMEGCRKIIEPMLEKDKDAPAAHLMMGALAFGHKRYDQAVEHLRAGEKIEQRLPGLHLMLGDTYLQMKNWTDAQRAYHIAMEIDGDNAQAYNGLAVALLAQDQYEQAAEAALTAVGLEHHLPAAHFTLGRALVRMGRLHDAVNAFKGCLSGNPKSPVAHSWLAKIYHELGDDTQAHHHQQKVRELHGQSIVRKHVKKSL